MAVNFSLYKSSGIKSLFPSQNGVRPLCITLSKADLKANTLFVNYASWRLATSANLILVTTKFACIIMVVLCFTPFWRSTLVLFILSHLINCRHLNGLSSISLVILSTSPLVMIINFTSSRASTKWGHSIDMILLIVSQMLWWVALRVDFWICFFLSSASWDFRAVSLFVSSYTIYAFSRLPILSSSSSSVLWIRTPLNLLDSSSPETVI